MISTRLYRERGRWIIMNSTMSYPRSIYLDIKKGVMVFVPRSGEHVFKIDRVVYCRFSHVYKLYFIRPANYLSGRYDDKIRIDIPALDLDDQTVEEYYKLYNECSFLNFEYLQMTYKIINYSNKDDKDSVADQEELDNVNTRRIIIDLNKIRNFWRFIISKFRRDRLNFHNHQY